jgi:hypothetical protein
MKTLVLLVLCSLQCLGAACAAQAVTAPVSEEVLVTTTRTDKTVIPGASLRRPADFALQRIKVSSDAPELLARKDDILATLRLLQSAASRDRTVELCVLLDGRMVSALRIDASSLKFSAGARPQTSEVIVALKSRLEPGAAAGPALFAKLKDFPAAIKPAGRAAIDVVGEVDLTLEDPAKYRSRVIELYAADARAVTASLGTEYRVVTRGIDRQLQWVRDGMSDVVIYIPYEYDVIPANVSSYSRP